MVIRKGKVLLGRRKSNYGDGEYALPGGHFEFGESFSGCAKRETKEETGLDIENIKFLMVSNERLADKHYVLVTLLADSKKGSPQVTEPEKVENWDWYSLNNLPKPIFRTSENAVKAYLSGSVYLDNLL